ncbi:MAG: phenylalanine--tRNA ligase subunit beta [Deltaproteobacteria bacterium]|nr:phenylalanine--tRNA ligase subunit beta [Deltaproteobacteria bacterium]
MRVSLNWLKDFVPIPLSPRELAERMTMCGLEVESLDPVGHGLGDIVAAQIDSIRPHAKAERLFVCEVDIGRETLPVVCGATNLSKGAMVPMALPGTRLPGGMTVEESTIRGVRSVGMLLAEDEMGLTDDHTGVMILHAGLKPGAKVSSALGLEDWALEVSLTPNRPDCASVMGIAREVAAITGQGLKRPAIRLKEDGQPVEELAGVTLEDPVGCPRYAAGMICGVEIKPSPFWMRYRLHTAGLRGINNVVDVTNYVLLELGQPLHAFDHDRLKENRIVVRRARDGEAFTTLDGKTHTLNAENLMICDGERSVAMAGIMGGLNSEIFEGSRNVLIESAYFDPVTIRRGSKRLGISTEASYRFERGIDIEGVPFALRRALMLMQELAGGGVKKGIIDRYPAPFRPAVIDLRVERTNRFLGTNLPGDRMRKYLEALEMEVQPADGGVLRVVAPSFRVDITREIDLVEEVARLEGYDRIPVTSAPVKPDEEKDPPELALGDRVREIMTGFGFSEVISYSFIAPESVEKLGPPEGSDPTSFVHLMNPLSVEQSVMRTTLAPGLLSTVQTNHSYGEKDLRLFEWGKVFIARGREELPLERLSVCAVMTGLSARKEWYSGEKEADFYDIKGALEGLLNALGVRKIEFRRPDATPPGYRSECCAEVFVSGERMGAAGEASPEAMKGYALEGEKVFLFDLDMERVLKHIPETIRFEALARYPAVFRDLSVVIAEEVESVRLRDIIEREGGDLVESVSLYDLFKGGRLGASEKAFAFRICYRSREGTLDGKEVNRIHETIIRKIVQETGGRLRER